MKEIPQQSLRDAFEYIDGAFIWKPRVGSNKETKRFNTCFAGKRVKPVKDRDGYLTIQLNGVRMKMHRAVFAYHHGYYPETVDHINRVRSDNRIDNLREATCSEQQWNKSAVKGCSKKGSRWRATIKAFGRRIFLGSFETEEEAQKAYQNAKSMLHNSNTL